jgi:hypothetical protein
MLTVAIIICRGFARWRQDQTRLGACPKFASERTVCCEVHNAVIRQIAAVAQPLDFMLGGSSTEPDIAIWYTKRASYCAQLVGGFGQWDLRADLCYVSKAPSL